MKKSVQNIAFLLPHIVMGGVEKVLLEILTEMQKQRPDLNIVVYSRKIVTDKYFIQFFKDNHIMLKDKWFLIKPHKFLPSVLYKIKNPIHKLFNHNKLRKDIIRGKYDVLIDFQFFNFAKIIHNMPVPKITWVHGSISHFNLHCAPILQYIPDYDKIICLSHSFENDFKEQYPEYDDKITCIYNSINAQNIRAKAKTDKSNGKYFCIVSRLDKEKDNETVINAFKIFSKNHPDAKLLIAGNGALSEKLHEMARDCPQIKFLGQIDEPYTLIKNSIAHILSSTSEGLGMVLLEAAALGTLSISSRCKSGPPEILMDGRAGILFTPGNQYELAQIMNDVWTGKIDTKKLIKTATDNLNRFSAKNNVKQIFNLIENI